MEGKLQIYIAHQLYMQDMVIALYIKVIQRTWLEKCDNFTQKLAININCIWLRLDRLNLNSLEDKTYVYIFTIDFYLLKKVQWIRK